MSLPSRWARLALLCLVPALGASKCKDKNKNDGTNTDNNTGDAVAQEFDVTMSVVSVNPSVVEENVGFTTTVRGSGFMRNGQVWIGGASANAVEFVDANTLRVEVGGLAAGRYDVEVVNPDGSSSMLRQALTSQSNAVDCQPLTVYFQTGKDSLTGDSLSILNRNISCYQGSTGPIRIEGHCDERGTTDYNLALGERRARSVSKWFAGQGVSSGRISTVSYGEEQPVSFGSDENAWARNRRAEIRLGR